MRRPNLFSHLTVHKLLVVLFFGGIVHCFPDQGRWSVNLSEVTRVVEVSKSLFKDSLFFIQVVCNSEHENTSVHENTTVHIQWTIKISPCWENYLGYGSGIIGKDLSNDTSTKIEETRKRAYQCNGHVVLEVEKAVGNVSDVRPIFLKSGSDDPVYKTPADGMYLLALQIFDPHPANATFSARVDIKMVSSDGGYLSAADWPLLPFYGAMCLIYVIFGISWLVVSFMQWRDLLRIQFWISGVILLGMLEKALFYAEYQGLNAVGYSMRSAVLFAELVSCAKRTLARMLVVIVSLGFGIVKPRLGPMLHRVVACGMLYFLLASVECYKRVFSPKNGLSNQILLASMPLALLDSAFCWWIFSNLVQTLRTLRLRRNLVKLALYRHFSTALIFSILASVVFMLYSLKMHRITNCRLDWKSLWIDEAYWHIQFSVLLFVIMILWRPANNNQRYAFSPLLDNPEDEDEEEDQFVNDSYGLKMRGNNTRSNSPVPKSSINAEEDLKWVEDNIPASIIDHALPVLDSDEEIMTTKFEISKMQ